MASFSPEAETDIGDYPKSIRYLEKVILEIHAKTFR
jgi:hypothetical protein